MGASCWETGQLEGEIAKGYWLPFSCPTTVAYSGKCEQEEEDNLDQQQPLKKGGKSGLWHSMMCSLGPQEARLANLIIDERQHNDNGDACDEV